MCSRHINLTGLCSPVLWCVVVYEVLKIHWEQAQGQWPRLALSGYTVLTRVLEASSWTKLAVLTHGLELFLERQDWGLRCAVPTWVTGRSQLSQECSLLGTMGRWMGDPNLAVLLKSLRPPWVLTSPWLCGWSPHESSEIKFLVYLNSILKSSSALNSFGKSSWCKSFLVFYS